MLGFAPLTAVALFAARDPDIWCTALANVLLPPSITTPEARVFAAFMALLSVRRDVLTKLASSEIELSRLIAFSLLLARASFDAKYEG